MLLNRDNYPYLNHRHDGDTCEYRNDNALFAMKPCQDRDYWIIEFLTAHCFDTFPLDTLVPLDILDKKIGRAHV